MIKIKVLSLKEILYKFILIFVCIIIFCFIISFAIKVFAVQKNDIVKNIVSEAIPTYYTDNYENKNWTRDTSTKNFLKEVLPIIGLMDVDDYGEQMEVKSEEKQNDKENNILINENVEKLYAEKISDSKYRIGSVYINDYSKLYLDLDELSKASYYKLSDKLKFFIYHTHTSESYTHVNNYEYSDYYRTEDDEYNVVSVGEKLSKELIKINSKNISVIQDKTKHDYPSYNGAYRASLKTIEAQMKNNKFDIFIDIHRDALSGNSHFRPTVEVEGKTVAKLMIVVGTNSSGLEHDNWMENLKFAIAIQEKANELYPGLFRDLHLSSSRYNQHISNNSIILEVGATGNTLEEATLSMEYFAQVIRALM